MPALVRIPHMQLFLQRIDALPPAQRKPVRAAIPSVQAQAVMSGSLEWVPGAWNAAWVDALHQVMTEVELLRFFRELTRFDFESSTFKSFAATLLRLFGKNAGAIMRRIPVGFSLMWRDAAELEVELSSRRSARLLVRGLAPELANPRWLVSFRGGMAGVFEVLRVEGEVVETRVPPGCDAAFELRWGADASPLAPT